MSGPFDAVLLVAFGGPGGPADVRPFLANVLRGRRVSPERVEHVAHHYDRFGGVSPLTALTMAQARALETGLAVRGVPLPVRVGMRNWHPYIKDTLAEMTREGLGRAIGFLAAAQRSYPGCLQYRENVDEARALLRADHIVAPDVTYVRDWHERPGFIEAIAANVRDALGKLPADRRDAARIVFTAHSIPVSMAERYPYREQLETSARLVCADLGRDDWALVYQSRSGRPEDAWLEPDVSDYFRVEQRRGLRSAVLCPIGFLCDHIEVLYDLDVEAMDTAREIGLPVVRAAAVNTHPRFIDAMCDAVLDVWYRYRSGRPLLLTAAPR